MESVKNIDLFDHFLLSLSLFLNCTELAGQLNVFKMFRQLLQGLHKQHVCLGLHQILDVTSDSVLQDHPSRTSATDV